MDLKEIYENAKQTVVGQDDALKRMILTVSNNLLDGTYNKRNIILIGPRGTGKSLMCETVAREMELPFKKIDIALSDGELSREKLDEAFITIASELYGGEEGLDIELDIPDELADKEDVTMEDILNSLTDEEKEKFLSQINGEDEEKPLQGIILLEGFDRIILEGGSNNIITMAKDSTQRILSLDGLGPIVDISGITFVAEGTYKESGNGFNGRKTLLEDELFRSRFTSQIKLEALDKEKVRDIIMLSDVSPLLLHQDIKITKEETDKIVGMIMERKVGLHSAPSAVDEVLMPKLIKKYF